MTSGEELYKKIKSDSYKPSAVNTTSKKMTGEQLYAKLKSQQKSQPAQNPVLNNYYKINKPQDTIFSQYQQAQQRPTLQQSVSNLNKGAQQAKAPKNINSFTNPALLQSQNMENKANAGDAYAKTVQKTRAFGKGAFDSATFGVNKLSNNPLIKQQNAINDRAADQYPSYEGAGEIVGSLPSMLIGGGELAAGSKLANWAGESIAKKALIKAAQGAIEQGAYSAASNVIPVATGKKTIQEAAQDVGTQAAIGGGLGGTLGGIGEAIGKNAKTATKLAEDATNSSPVNVAEKLTSQQELEVYQEAIKANPEKAAANGWDKIAENLDNQINPKPITDVVTGGVGKVANAVGKTTEDIKPENGMSSALGAQNSEFPYEEKTSKAFSNTFKNTDIFNQAEKDMLSEPDYKYDVMPEKKSLKEAEQSLQVDFDGEVKDLSTKQSFNGVDVDKAMGILSQYTQEARQTGDYSKVVEWSKNIQQKGTEAGQTVQAFAKYSRTPEGVAVSAQNYIKGVQEEMTKVNREGRLVNNTLGNKIENETDQIIKAVKKSPKTAEQAINSLLKGNQEGADKLKEIIKSGKFTDDDIADIIRAKYNVPTLTNEDFSQIVDYMQKAINAPTEKERFELQLMAARVAANKVPATVLEKMDNWRYMAMLGNVKTHIRNIASNAVMDMVRRSKNAIGTGLEKFISKENRTKAILTPRDKALKEFADKDFDTAYYTLMKDGKNGFGGLIQQAKTIYKNPLLEKLRIGNNKALDYEDLFFAHKAYTDSLAQAMKARGLSEKFLTSGTPQAESALRNIRTYAINESLKSTFRESNSLAAALNHLEHLNKKSKLANNASHILVGGIVPFKKTPLNILKRGAEYSPLGLLDSLTREIHRVRTKEITSSEFVDKLASGLTGTGIMTLGGFLAANNIIVGKDTGTTKETSYNSMLGNQDYALNIGGKTFTLDWIGSAVMPLFAGVEFYNSIAESGDAKQKVETGFGRFLSAMSNISDPLVQTSMLQGINDLIDSAKYGTNAIGSALASTVTDYATQYIPTVFGQAARTVSPTTQSTTATKDSPLSQYGEQTLRKVVSKIPGANLLLEPKVDLWGREVTNGNAAERAVQNFLSPGYYQSDKSTAVDKELERLYSATGDTSVLPSYAAKYVNDDKGNRKYISSSDYTKFQKALGQESFEALKQLINTSDYQNTNDDGKSSLVANVFKYARKDVKDKYLNNQLK